METYPRSVEQFQTCYLNSRVKRLVRIHKMSQSCSTTHHMWTRPRPKQNTMAPTEWKSRETKIQMVIRNHSGHVAKYTVIHEHTHIPQASDRDDRQQHETIKESINREASDLSKLFKP